MGNDDFDLGKHFRHESRLFPGIAIAPKMAGCMLIAVRYNKALGQRSKFTHVFYCMRDRPAKDSIKAFP